MTKAGYEELQRELAELQERRPRLVERLANARSMGDLSENNDYHNAKEELEFLDGRIVELEQVLSHAEIVKTSSGKPAAVGVGTKVKVAVNGQEHLYDVVGEWEANPKEKKISPESPLGKALVGKKVGEQVEVDAPAGKVLYEILSID